MALSFGLAEYTTPGTYTFQVPVGVNWVWCTAVGGGGGGGSTPTVTGGTSPFASGGGAGEIMQGAVIPTTPLGTMLITVGAGGAGGHYPTTSPQVGPLWPAVTAQPGGGQPGEDTVVGPFRASGGSGGMFANVGARGGSGGGPRANLVTGQGLGYIDSDAGDITAHGWYPIFPDGTCWAAGSGGGGGGGAGTGGTGGNGGDCVGHTGGVSGAFSGIGGGGGGGAAGLFGNGGNGGDMDATVPAAPAGSYGAGGGGAGSNSTVIHAAPPINAFDGAAGIGGYVLISWFANV